MGAIAVAGLTARWMAEAAARDGFEVVALDLFGDVDTCAAASRWMGIGSGMGLQIDEARTLEALALLARQGEVEGWVAGSGFEGRPALLARGAALLPLLGSAPDAVARLRDAPAFFAGLDAHGIVHPEIALVPPPEPAGWLLKDGHGCGGWHVREATKSLVREPLPPHHYWQRAVPGLAMSATFVANGQAAVLLGFNRQIARRIAGRPHVYSGIVGPLALDAVVAQHLQHIVDTLAAAYGLRGLASLDFMLDGDRLAVLEVNPRPPASMDLYADWRPMRAHVRACLQGELPKPPASAAAAAGVYGNEIVFANRPLRLDAEAAHWLQDWPEVHDLPCAGQRFEVDQPLCSVGARGSNAAEVLARLHESREALLKSLETCT
ncbi:ATP-grasp domain protein [Rubrivivax sp. A210]|uniref:ATP-grasp domain-containing protein n=1 Tax=Rubrivivax sp. A210 TaxID=2772301 RepID=UPI001919CCA0|nr:ATP-grasp domain-containing protein [Rubrivivax sp. A210]CAD5372172.1 ATP-grasp domain protein [Rubrivivax sp. A210]